ncbi:PQQ-binding-like beta-propeller repeat protein [Cellulomonas sp. 179-A 4D5 NHS]|uniref:outer membrane protein assembly factor BamB family protein n=1 Tax=Cellulomonas sp. 179-A 4D5 NHS TaxID=3142378 RepID=UPI0039A07138
MRAPGRGQVDVELVEAVGAAAPAVERGADWRELVRRVPRRAWTVVAGVVVLTLGAGGFVEWRAERAQTSRLERIEGLTGSLAAPLTDVWEAPGEGVIGIIGDVLVLYGPEGEGVLGVGLDDGAPRWERSPGGSFGCWFVRGDGGTRAGWWQGPVDVLEPGSAVLACVDSVPFEGVSFPNVVTGSGGASALGPQSEVSVLDPASGAILRRLVLPGSGHPTQIEDSVVAVGLDAEDRLVGSRWSLLTGELAWEYTGPNVGRVAGVSMWSDTETMTWEAGDVSVTLDSRTGDAIDPPSEGEPGESELDRFTLPDGGTAVSSVIDGTGVELTVTDADGTPRFTTTGHAFEPLVDDGTAPHTMLVQPSGGAGIMAVDARTGEDLWRSATPRWASPVVLAGRVVLREKDRVAAVDVHTGETVWEHDDHEPDAGGGLVTDGRTVLILARVDGQTSLVARDVETGEQLWRIPSPVDAGALQPLRDGRVLLSGSRRTVLLAP